MIRVMVVVMAYKALHGLAPVYLADFLHQCTPTPTALSSQNDYLLVTPDAKQRRYGDRSFPVAAAALWNSTSMPKHISPWVHSGEHPKTCLYSANE